MSFCTSCGEPKIRGTCPKCDSGPAGPQCRTCNQNITDPNEVIIIGGAEHHRACKGLGSTSELTTAGGQWDSSVNDESCPGCNQPLKKGLEMDSGIVIVGGQSWHRSCKGLDQDSEPERWAGNKAETCGTCNQAIGAGEKVIQGGQEHHRACLGLKGESESSAWQGNAQKTCPGCGNAVAASQNDMGTDLVIVGGEEWHRSCKNLTGESQNAASNISYTDHCSKCGKEVGLTDKVIKLGQVMHRECLGESDGVLGQ